MARRPLRTPEGGDDDVNMTPLLDIVFIMLIFFIVTSTFIKEPGVQVTRPEAEIAEEQKLVSILVAVTENNEIWINKRQVELDGVRSAVERLRRENPRGGAVIQADAGSETRYMIEVLNQVRAAGVTQIAVATEQA